MFQDALARQSWIVVGTGGPRAAALAWTSEIRRRGPGDGPVRPGTDPAAGAAEVR